MADLASLLSYFRDSNYVTGGLLLVITGCLAWNFFKDSLHFDGKKRAPGPMGIPFFGYTPFFGKEPHLTFWNMKKKYGDIIGMYFGPKYTVVLNEYSVMKEVLCNPNALNRAPNVFDHIPQLGFIKENGEKWLEQRRFCLSSARDLGLGRGHWEDLIVEEAVSYAESLKQLKGKPTDILHSLASSISSNILSLLIGRKLKKDKEADKIQLSVDFAAVSFSYMGPSYPTTVVPGLRRFCEIFKIAGYDRAFRIIRQFCDFTREEVNRHKTSPLLRDSHDFISTYLGKLSSFLPSDKHYFSETMLEGNLNVLFLGGSDTILSSMGWLLRLMAQHKDIQQKVYVELMEVIGKDDRASYEERNKFPYTFAVMMEAQRFSSIVPLNTTRKAIADIEVNGITIPKGTEITTNLWALHNDPNYWKEPEKFIPERFLTDGGTKLVKKPPSYAPFSVGRRNCPGETIAWMEILSYFTEIVKRFEISTESKPEFEIVNGLVAHLTGQPLCFKERID